MAKSSFDSRRRSRATARRACYQLKHQLECHVIEHNDQYFQLDHEHQLELDDKYYDNNNMSAFEKYGR